MAKNIEEYPNPTLEDSHKFWDEFTLRHPELAKQLQSRVFDAGRIAAFQPKTLDDNSYRIYERYLKRWLFNNGFWFKQIDEIYVSLNDGNNMGVRAIDTETIVSIKAVNDKISAIEIKEPDMGSPITILVKENVEDLKKNIYIF